MTDIKIVHQPSQQRLAELGVSGWGIWEKAVSVFPWTYDATETCYFLTGEVVVTPDGGKPISMGKGDLVTFPKGMSCRWDIKQAVKKHFIFE